MRYTSGASRTRRPLLAAALGCFVVAALLVSVAPAPAQAAAVFSNTTPITIPSQGLNSPYPSSIQVSSLAGTITDVSVTLLGLAHSEPDDVDMVLLGPGGQHVVLMADAGGPNGFDGNLTFDDEATELLPDDAPPPNGFLQVGAYRPANHGSYFIDPALTNTALSVFDGTTPNGAWSLYGGDDLAPNQGSISGGWSLDITTTGSPGPAHSNTTPISIPGQGLFSPYPSTIEVSGLSGPITDVNVTLRDVSHNNPDDVDIVLIGPLGQYAVLMADAGGPANIVDVDLTLDDQATSLLPNAGLITSGTYRPTNRQSYFIDPALTNTSLSAFDGTSANGTWSLYGGDDAVTEPGSISGGWGLDITTSPTPIEVTSFDPTEGFVGDAVVVTGSGFAEATSVQFGETAAATFMVDSPTQITATVPDGAGTGPISVVVPAGTGTSAIDFVVLHERDVSLTLTKRRAKGAVSVDDGFADCGTGVPVKVQRREDGRWRTIGSTLTNDRGAFTVPGVARQGRYRAVARETTLSSGDVCLESLSPRVRQ